MSDRKNSLAKRMKWRIEWLAQTGAESIIARLPGAFVFRLGEGIGALLWPLMGYRRRIVLKNLRIAFAGEKTLAELQVMARQSFIRSVANLVSAVHTANMSVEKLAECTVVENPELAEATVKQGNGMLLLPPHMGNWEILSRLNRFYPDGHAAGAMYRPLNNPYLDARVCKKRQSEGTQMFSKRDSLHHITSFLKAGGLIGILADQRAGMQGIVSPFFGRLTRSSPLPHLLVRRCGCTAIAVSLRTLRPGKWSVRYHSVDAPADTTACMAAVERAMRESPVDVFWFQDRWKIYLPKEEEKKLQVWLGSAEAHSSLHPHRALVWLPSCPLDWELNDNWQHADVVYEFAKLAGTATPKWLPEQAIVHEVSDINTISETQREIARIDATAALPLDFVLAGCQDNSLRRAARREAIQFFSTVS
jgi:Kdo2-lipid IVA lauroyltransferase/acyltransferase